MGDTAARIPGGAYTPRKIAVPSPIGIAKTRATAVVRSVPTMNVRAPNFPCSGSQVVPVMRLDALVGKRQASTWQENSDRATINAANSIAALAREQAAKERTCRAPAAFLDGGLGSSWKIDVPCRHRAPQSRERNAPHRQGPFRADHLFRVCSATLGCSWAVARTGAAPRGPGPCASSHSASWARASPSLCLIWVL